MCGVGVGVSVPCDRCRDGVRDLLALDGMFSLPPLLPFCPSGFRIFLEKEVDNHA